MRLLNHPNVVDLRAFFYSNGDKARVIKVHQPTVLCINDHPLSSTFRPYRKMKST